MSNDDPDPHGRPPRWTSGKPAAPSWQADPFARHEQRWWDGERWSDKVRSGGAMGIDPPGVDTAPEAYGTSGTPAAPITDAAAPLRFVPTYLPRMVLLGVVLLVAILLLVLVGIATAAT